MNFWKMNGAGNDFIVINNMQENIPHEKLGKIAEHLCERHLSIGADGLIAVERPENGCDYRMLFFNADGSPGEMCGNGARCICRFAFDSGIVKKRIQKIETTSGIVSGERLSSSEYRIRMTGPSVIKFDESIDTEIGKTLIDYIELGSPGLPHAVINCRGISSKTDDDVRQLARNIRNSKSLHKGANVNLCEILDKGETDERIFVKTYERGVEDFTYSCGTGSVSVALSLSMRGLIGRENIKIVTKGGILKVSIKNGIFLSGPSYISAKGETGDLLI